MCDRRGQLLSPQEKMGDSEHPRHRTISEVPTGAALPCNRLFPGGGHTLSHPRYRVPSLLGPKATGTRVTAISLRHSGLHPRGGLHCR